MLWSLGTLLTWLSLTLARFSFRFNVFSSRTWHRHASVLSYTGLVESVDRCSLAFVSLQACLKCIWKGRIFFIEKVGTLQGGGGSFINTESVFKHLALYGLFTVKTPVCKTSLIQQTCFQSNLQGGDKNYPVDYLVLVERNIQWYFWELDPVLLGWKN